MAKNSQRSSRTRLVFAAVLPALHVVLACTIASGKGARHDSTGCSAKPFSRNWDKAPATVVVDGFAGTLYALGDVHGAFADAVRILTAAALIKSTGADPVHDFAWTGGDAVLVQVGDLIDKGPKSLDVLRFFIALEEKAAAAGGRVVVLAGNHEMSFLADPLAKKAKEFRAEIIAAGQDVCDDVYAETCPIGKWLRERPAAARVNGVFLSHSGWTGGKSLDDITQSYRNAVDRGEFDSAFTCGDHRAKVPTSGFFNANDWWTSSDVVDADLKAVGATQILFGHDPSAFGADAVMTGYFGSAAGRAIIKLDVGLWEHPDAAAIYKCSRWRPGAAGCAAPERMRLPAKDKNLPPVTEALPVSQETNPPSKTPEIRLGC